MSTYQVRAVRWDEGWELHIVDVGVTQSHGLRDAERMVRDYLRLDLGTVAARAAEIVITPDIGDLGVAAAEVRCRSAELRRLQDDFARQQRTVVRKLKNRGFSGADIARVLDISEQRVSQLIKAAGGPKATPEGLLIDWRSVAAPGTPLTGPPGSCGPRLP